MEKLVHVVLSFAVVVACLGAANLQDKKDEPKTQRVELNADLVAQAPAAWKVQASTKQFRLIEATLPSSEKGQSDAVLVITHFGKGGGGGLEPNLTRWYGMVEQPDGTPTEKVAKKHEVKTDAAKITWLEIPGTYLDRPFPQAKEVTKRPNFRMFTAMIDGGKEGPYWIRVTGPDAVMQAQRDAFEKFLKSIQKK